MAIGQKEQGLQGPDAAEFDSVVLTDTFDVWRLRTNKMLSAFTSNTVTASNTVHSNGQILALTIGHSRLWGDFAANNLFANGSLSGGEKGNPGDLEISSNCDIDGILIVSNNATFGIDGEDESIFNSRVTIHANTQINSNTVFTANVYMLDDTFIGGANTDTLTVNATSTFDAEVTFEDEVTFNANVIIEGDTTNITGNTFIGGANTDTLTVNATTTFDGEVTLRDEVFFNANVIISNNVMTNDDTLLFKAEANGTSTLFANAAIQDLSIKNQMLVNDHYTIATDGSGADFDIQLGDTFNFNEGEGVDITLTADTVTIAGEDASTSNKGIASFDSNDFGVSSGAVSLNDAVTKSVTGDSGTATPVGHALAIEGTANEVETSGTGSTITIGLPDDVTIGNDLTVTDNIFIDSTKVINGEGSTKFVQNATANDVVLKTYSETASTTTTSSGTQAIDLSGGLTHTITLNNSITTFSFTNVPGTSGDAVGVTLILVQGTGGNKTITWPSGYKWQGGLAPTLSSTEGDIDIVTFLTIDDGTVWYGSTVGLDFS